MLKHNLLILILLAGVCLLFAASTCTVALPAEADLREPPRVEPDLFVDVDDEQEYPGAEELRSILAQVPGERYEIAERKRRDRRVTSISGLFRVTLAWPEDGALRLSFWEPEQLRLHLWNGQRGVTLRYHRKFHQIWAAYGVTREGEKPQPSNLVLWATDGGRYRRVGVGTVKVHYHQGHVILTRGDLELVSAPMEGPPREVFLEANAQVRGLAMVRSAVVPDEPRVHPEVVRVERPAELPWEHELPEGVSLTKLPDGRVELQAKERAPEAQAGVAVCRPGLHEFIFEVDDADPGTGVYLGDREGRQVCRIAFFRDRQMGRTTFGLLPVRQREIDRSHDFRRQVVPFAGPHQRLRVIAGAGVAKVWTSADGVHWSQPAPAAMGIEGACATVGLYCLEHDKPRSIKLSRIEVRRLDALESLVPDTVRQQAGLLFASESEPFVKAKDLDAWEEQVAASRSPDVEVEDWWRACALATLAATNTPLGQPILERLLDRSLRQTYSLERGLRILDEAGLVYNSPDWPAVDRLTAHYERFGRKMARRAKTGVGTAVSRAMVCSPFWAERRLFAFSDVLVRHELVTKVGEDRWPEVAELCRRLRFWNRVQEEQPPASEHVRHLAEWGAAQAAEYVAEAGRDQPPGAPLRWQHPVVERLSREGYNILAELEATLDAQAYREACQVISTSLGREGVGLLTDRKDLRLWTSLPLAIESAMQEHPVLRETMQDDFSTLGEFRVRQAIAAGNSSAVGKAALQFYGTDAAADAHRWLGDRSLAGGRLSEAAEHYREALRSASDERQGEIAARLRLAGALEGRDVGSPAKGPVQIGERRFTAGQFERLVQQVRQEHASSHLAGEKTEEAASPAAEQAFAPAGYEARPWAHLDGRRVKRPRAVPDRGFDWPGRQIAVLVTDRHMLANNQIDQAAYDLRNGRQVWAQCRAVHEQFQQWPLERMRPTLAVGRVVVRQLGDEGPELVSLEAATGRLVWSSKPDGHVASDPLVLGDALLALTVSYDPGDKLTLWLTRFDFDSGHVISQTPLAEFRDLWQHRLPCQATAADGRIVATAAGCVVCCNASGDVSWLREQIWIPPPGDSHHQAPQWFDQVHEPPLVENDRVYALQPGVWALECLDVASGHLAWRRTLAEATRLVGLAPGRLMVQTTDGLLALDPDSGRTLWRYDREQGLETRLLYARLCAPPGRVLVCCRERESESQEGWRFVFVWIDLETGEPSQETVLTTPAQSEEEQPDLWLGPLVARDGRQWAFFGPVEDPASRDIVELVPTATPPGKGE